jgi:hypothetical protein
MKIYSSLAVKLNASSNAAQHSICAGWAPGAALIATSLSSAQAGTLLSVHMESGSIKMNCDLNAISLKGEICQDLSRVGVMSDSFLCGTLRCVTTLKRAGMQQQIAVSTPLSLLFCLGRM